MKTDELGKLRTAHGHEGKKAVDAVYVIREED